jgi:Major Facilitator Superfamily
MTCPPAPRTDGSSAPATPAGGATGGRDAAPALFHAPLAPAAVNKIITGIMLAMFLSALEQTIVAPALPTIGVHLGDIENLSWVVTAYLLSATAATPLFGKLSDIHGRRGILLTGVTIFIVASVACALAPTMAALIAARAAGHRRPSRTEWFAPRMPLTDNVGTGGTKYTGAEQVDGFESIQKSVGPG